MKRTLLCRLGVHKWKVVREPGVKPFAACVRCEKERVLDFSPEGIAGAFSHTDPYNLGNDPGNR